MSLQLLSPRIFDLASPVFPQSVFPPLSFPHDGRRAAPVLCERSSRFNPAGVTLSGTSFEDCVVGEFGEWVRSRMIDDRRFC